MAGVQFLQDDGSLGGLASPPESVLVGESPND
jgi:hypothetical protein